MADLMASLVEIRDALNGAGVPYALVGGLAVGVYDKPRSTEDIDLVVAAAAWPQIIQLMGDLGYRQFDEGMPLASGTMEMRRLVRLDPASGDHVILDCLLDGNDATREALTKRIAIPWEGGMLWVGSVSAIIRLKQLRLSKQDLLDIESLERLGSDES